MKKLTIILAIFLIQSCNSDTKTICPCEVVGISNADNGLYQIKVHMIGNKQDLVIYPHPEFVFYSKNLYNLGDTIK